MSLRGHSTPRREAGAREVRLARDARERTLLWAGRKGAFGALGRITPDYYTMDGVIPRSTMPEVLRRSPRLAGRTNLTICNVFHAGDGNLHPLICLTRSTRASLTG